MSDLNMADVEMVLARSKRREACLHMAQRAFANDPATLMSPEKLTYYAEKLFQFCQKDENPKQESPNELPKNLVSISSPTAHPYDTKVSIDGLPDKILGNVTAAQWTASVGGSVQCVIETVMTPAELKALQENTTVNVTVVRVVPSMEEAYTSVWKQEMPGGKPVQVR